MTDQYDERAAQWARENVPCFCGAAEDPRDKSHSATCGALARPVIAAELARAWREGVEARVAGREDAAAIVEGIAKGIEHNLTMTLDPVAVAKSASDLRVAAMTIRALRNAPYRGHTEDGDKS